jgi:hypothetical protein
MVALAIDKFVFPGASKNLPAAATQQEKLAELYGQKPQYQSQYLSEDQITD